MTADDRAARLFEGVAEDERLRGSLEDDAYGPILDWAAGRAERLANLPDLDQEEAADLLWAAMSAVVTAAEVGDCDGLSGIDPRVADTIEVQALTEAARAASPTPLDRVLAMTSTFGSESTA